MKPVYFWVSIIALLAFGIGVKVGRYHQPSFGAQFVEMAAFRSPARQCTTGNSNTNIGVNNGQVTINSESL